MRILAVEKEISSIDTILHKEILYKEAQKVYQFYQSGFIREIYFNEMHNAVLIIECDSISEANDKLQSLPLIFEDLIKFELMQLNPYTGFERLFKSDNDKMHNI